MKPRMRNPFVAFLGLIVDHVQRQGIKLLTLGSGLFAGIFHVLAYVFYSVFHYTRHHPFKMLLSFLVISVLLVSFLVIGCHLWIEWRANDRLYTEVYKVPSKKVALLLGTVKRLANGQVNRYFQYRIEAAAQLYKAGKIQHIIASGDNHTRFYNEPIDMKRALMAQGIPQEAITLDYAGFRTLDSIVRCKKIFSQEDIIIISQAFHNKRALFISDFYNIQAIGFNAKDIPLRIDKKTKIREYFARFKAVLDLYILHTPPKFLGEKVDISV